MLGSKPQAPRGESFNSPFDSFVPQNDELDWTRGPASGKPVLSAEDLNPFDVENATCQPDILSLCDPLPSSAPTPASQRPRWERR